MATRDRKVSERPRAKARRPKEKYVVYARSAIADAASIERQRRNRAEFMRRRSVRLQKASADDGSSGLRVGAALRALIEDARAGRVQNVVVEEPERLSRSIGLFATIVGDLCGAGVKVLFANGVGPELLVKSRSAAARDALVQRLRLGRERKSRPAAREKSFPK